LGNRLRRGITFQKEIFLSFSWGTPGRAEQEGKLIFSCIRVSRSDVHYREQSISSKQLHVPAADSVVVCGRKSGKSFKADIPNGGDPDGVWINAIFISECL